jgi:hypothetical protein
MSNLKEKLYKEFELKMFIACKGVRFEENVFKNLDLGGIYQEQIHTLFEMDIDSHVGIDLPPVFILPHGIMVDFKADKRSDLQVEYENGKFYIVHKGNELTQVDFLKRPRYYGQKTSDGKDMRTIAVNYANDALFVAYSNECALKEKGKECLFCNINATKDVYAEYQNIEWKYPRQIGETTKAAYSEGFRHITISGGFIPERREVDYYLDVAEAIQNDTGLENFNGTACIGAPLDLSVIDKYKEAGFRTLAINLEVWDKRFFAAYCPGKEDFCGGQAHWIKSIEYAVKKFGFGNVRSMFVGGLEPKRSVLEGLEYLASKGVCAFLSPWIPNPGSMLEGHSSPDWKWHLELAYKNSEILRKNGLTFEQLYYSSASSNYPVHDIYRIENNLLTTN